MIQLSPAQKTVILGQHICVWEIRHLPQTILTNNIGHLMKSNRIIKYSPKKYILKCSFAQINKNDNESQIHTKNRK